MVASRRDVIKVVGAGTAMLATAGRTGSALAQATAQAPTPTLRELPFHGQTPTPDYGAPSTASREVTIVNFDILEPAGQGYPGPRARGLHGPRWRRHDLPGEPSRVQRLRAHAAPAPRGAPMVLSGVAKVSEIDRKYVVSKI